MQLRFKIKENKNPFLTFEDISEVTGDGPRACWTLGRSTFSQVK